MGKETSGKPFGEINRIEVTKVNGPGPDRTDEALGRLRNLQAERLEKKAIEGERSMASREVEEIKLEEAELRARREAIEKGQISPAAVGLNVAGDPQMKGMAQTLLDIYALGTKNGIDVSPAISAILTGNPGLAVATQAKPQDGIPQWMGTFMAKMAEKAFDSPKDDPKVAILEERVRSMEGAVSKDLNDLKALIMSQGKNQVDPNNQAIENVKSVGALLAVLQGLVPKAAPVVEGGPSSELALKLQDRQWTHEERIQELKTKAQEIAVTREIEEAKIRKSQEQMATIPQMIGTVIATTIMEKGGAKKEAAPAPEAPRTTLEIKKSADRADGPITINCLDCHKPLTFMSNAQHAQCVCGSKYDLHLTITEGGPTEVHTTEPPAGAGPAAETPYNPEEDEFRRGQ